MRGSIQKKGKVYYAVIALNGKRKWFKGGDTKREAEKVLNDKLSEVLNGTYKEISKITFSEFSEIWLKSYAEAKLKVSTFKGYKEIISKLNSIFGSYNLSNITVRELQNYVSERKQKVSGKTVINELIVIKRMFKHAFIWNYIKNNPAEHIERPKIEKHEIEILSPEEIDKLLSIDNHYRVAFMTAFLTGMRAGELWGLQWGDIDWNSKQVYVRRSLCLKEFQTPKTKYSIRKIDIPDSLIHELKKWKLACPVNKDNLVFPSPEGMTSQHNNVVKRYFNQALRKSGLRQVSFHSLRHSNASFRIQVGQNIKYIQSQLGHASINITLDIYGHLFNDINFSRQQVELLEASFKSVRNPLEKHSYLKPAISANR